MNGGDVTVTNYATLTGGTAAIDATSTSSDPVVINNYGNITGVVLTANAAFDNETGAVWNLAGNSIFASGANTLINAGTINASGTSGITSGGSLSVTNTGTVNVLSGTFDIAADVSGPAHSPLPMVRSWRLEGRLVSAQSSLSWVRPVR